MILPKMTRRTAIGAGMATAAMAGLSGTALGRAAQPVGAVVVDEAVVPMDQIARHLRAQGLAVPVIGMTLDVGGYGQFKAMLGAHGAVLGVSSGAMLFCLEQIAADHGFRLTGRIAQRADRMEFGRIAMTMVRGVQGELAADRGSVRAYQPTHGDAVLHVWTMRKLAGAPMRAQEPWA